eukprot:SM000512S17819  [mRNA]  locus=s512:937:4814:- [translate_table: standard]
MPITVAAAPPPLLQSSARLLDLPPQATAQATWALPAAARRRSSRGSRSGSTRRHEAAGRQLAAGASSGAGAAISSDAAAAAAAVQRLVLLSSDDTSLAAQGDSAAIPHSSVAARRTFRILWNLIFVPIPHPPAARHGAGAGLRVSTSDVMGDKHAALLVLAVLRAWRCNEAAACLEVYALGGKEVEAAGAVLIGDNSGLSSIGLAEALPLIWPSLRLQAAARAFLNEHPPDVVVLVDYPGVNIPFGRYLKKRHGCRVVYYVPPNEWLWNTSRTAAIVGMSDVILATYKGEADYYSGAGGKVVDVGHPLLDLASTSRLASRAEAREALGVPQDAKLVALFPASREQELRHVWPVVADAAAIMQAAAAAAAPAAIEHACSRGRLQFVVPVVCRGFVPALGEGLEARGLAADTILWEGASDIAMAAADVALAKSGSVNVELALFDVPQVVMYRLDAATAWLARAVLRVRLRHISLVNLILDEQVVPELVQEAATAAAVAEAALGLLQAGRRRDAVLAGYAALRPALGSPGTADRAAKHVLEVLLAHIAEVPGDRASA